MFNSNGAMNATAVRIVLLIPVIGLILVVLWLGVIKIVDKIVLSKIADSTKQIEDDILFIESLEETRFDSINQIELNDSQLSDFIELKEEAQGGIKALNRYKRSKKKTIRKALAMGSYINELAEHMGEALHPMFANVNEEIIADVVEETVEEVVEPSLAYKDQTPNLQMFLEEPNSLEEELMSTPVFEEAEEIVLEETSPTLQDEHFEQEEPQDAVEELMNTFVIEEAEEIVLEETSPTLQEEHFEQEESQDAVEELMNTSVIEEAEEIVLEETSPTLQEEHFEQEEPQDAVEDLMNTSVIEEAEEIVLEETSPMLQEEHIEQDEHQDTSEELMNTPVIEEDEVIEIEEENTVENPTVVLQREEFANLLYSSTKDKGPVEANSEPWKDELVSESQIINEETSPSEEQSHSIALEDSGIATQVLEFQKLIDEVDEPKASSVSVDEVVIDTVAEQIESLESSAIINQRNLFAELLHNSTKPKAQEPVEKQIKEVPSASINSEYSQVNREYNIEPEVLKENMGSGQKQHTKQNLYQRDIKADHIIDETDTYSILQSDVKLRGNIEAKDVIKVFGSIYGNIDSTSQVSILKGALVEGNITSNRLFIELANVYGDIKANQLLLDGNVVGDIISTDTIVIGAFAKLRGNVISPSVEIRQGAQVQGHFEIGDEI